MVGAKRRRARRVEIRVPFTSGTDLAFGVSLRVPRRRRRTRGVGVVRHWGAAVARSALLVVNLVMPPAIVASTTQLADIADAAFPPPAPAALASASSMPRPVLQARRTLTTVTTPDPPQVRAVVVAPGETLLSIAARFGVAPQTIAYDNGIRDSAELRAGQSLLVPPFDAAIHVLGPKETISEVASRFGVAAETVRTLNRIASDDGDATAGRLLLLPVPDARYPGFRLRLSDPPRVLAPRVRWPTDGVITQLYSPGHQGVDIAAPYGAPIVASDSGTVSFVGDRGPGGLAVCVYQDWGLETCSYHASATYVEVGERVIAGQRIAAIGTSGVTTGPHVHWEARTNGALVDPLTYASYAATPAVGGATGSP